MDSNNILQIPEKCTIATALEFKHSIAAVLDSLEGGLVIDAEKVVQIDTTGLQLLAATVSYCADKCVEVEWSAVADELKANADLSGFSDVLGF